MRPLAVLLTLAAVLVASPAAAGPPTDRVREYTNAVLRVLDDAALRPGDRREAVRRIASEVFDLNETARRALGPHWQTRTPAEREEFVQLFAELLERTYIAQIDRYGGERLRITGEKIDGDRAVVVGRVVTKRGVEVPVEARMLQRTRQWFIYDVSIENISLIANYRAQFDRIVRTASYAELLRRLRDRTGFLNEQRRKGPRDGTRPAS